MTRRDRTPPRSRGGTTVTRTETEFVDSREVKISEAEQERQRKELERFIAQQIKHMKATP